MGISNLLRKFLAFLAFNKPWPYLSVFCYVAMKIIVLAGNPLLPIPSLAQYGWAWHHIPEIFMFLFFGMWFGDFKILSRKKISWIDSIFLTLLMLMTFAETVSFHLIVVIPIVTLPSFIGYFIKRWHTLTHTEA